MTDQLILSKRLKNIMNFLPSGAFFADIGSDHAYLPIAVCQIDQAAKAIAGELNEGPYRSAIKHVKEHGLTRQIKVIKADGLEAIQNDPVKQVVIAGMGGGLIRSILEKGEPLLASVERLILQPNVDSHYVRNYLVNSEYQLIAENILDEDGHIYEILVADKVAKKDNQSYTDKEILFGPFLLKEKNQAFRQKWQKEKNNLEQIIDQMRRAHRPNDGKIGEFNNVLTWIKEVLEDG